jgi:4-alpha-glucanotransferase
MNITFRLRFHTRFGQSLFVSGNHPLLGNEDAAKAVPLVYRDPEHWEVTLDADVPRDLPIVYGYLLRESDGSITYDWGSDKTIGADDLKTARLLLLDAWNSPAYIENAFYTEPFKLILLRGNRVDFPIQKPPNLTHRFKVKAPLLTANQTLGMLGSFNGWDVAHPVLFSRSSTLDYLCGDVDFSECPFPVEYKYAVYEVPGNTFLQYESGANRTLADGAADGTLTRVEDGFARLPSSTWRGAGVAIPVFSLRSGNSFGVGEFSDIKLLVQWCARTGLKLIQLLPINDTSAAKTWKDSYPYAAISAFALHPIYLDLSKVVSEANKPLLAALEPQRQRLNQLDAVDYEAVMGTKIDFLRRVYPLQRSDVFASHGFEDFVKQNRAWLVPYSVFCCLRDRFGTSDFTRWPMHSRYDAAAVQAMAEPGSREYDEVAFYFFVQFHLHLQLRDASAYAHEHGVILKGDLPIGVCRHGADAWQEPELYHLDAQAGAPPDAFSDKGQNWGLPTYNWPRMKQTGFAWWKQRFEQIGRYFDAFRIDHILGFFRIWTIPLHAVEGVLGHFEPAIPVHVDEFARRGIGFDRRRFVSPHITEAVLADFFGSDAGLVMKRFLRKDPSAELSLKPEFATQRQVERYFESLPLIDANPKLKQGLYDLISNVILLQEEGSHGQLYHFRFGMEKTSAFRDLDDATRGRLSDFYADYFFRRQEQCWTRQAMETLPTLKRVTQMLVCGEDLGLVPDCVPAVMNQLGILSLEIQRMPKDPGRRFSRPEEAPYMSVVTPCSHDMSTIRGWWRENPALIQEFFTSELKQAGHAPKACSGWLNRVIVRRHLASPAMWSIFQLQDLLGMDETLRRVDPDAERINIPANPRHYWRYRMHLTLEQLLEAADFNASLKQALRESGR